MNKFFKYIMILILVMTFTGCDKNDKDYGNGGTSSYIEEDDAGSLTPITVSLLTSFAEDIKTYDIASLDGESDSNSSAGSKSGIRKAEKQQADDTKSDNEDDSADEDSDDDDGKAKSEDEKDDNDGDDDDDSDDDSDDSDDDADDDSDDDSNDDNNTKTKTLPISIDYKSLGHTKVELNGKEYKFTVGQDNYGNRIQSPQFTKNPDGTYTISIAAYVIDEKNVVIEDGVFTLSFKIRSLNESSIILMTANSNILTNSAKEPVYATVMVSKESGAISMTIASDKFEVYNKQRTRTFSAQFGLGFTMDVSF